MSKLLGVLLCGGESRRMGRDKGLIKDDATHWAEKAIGLFDELSLEWVVSLREEQSTSYADLFARERMVFDEGDERGPLRGIMSVHRCHPDRDLLVVATDMPALTAEPLQQLISQYKTDRDGILYEGEKLETLCAIYTHKFLQALQQNAPEQFALRKLVVTGNFTIVPLPADFTELLRNHNQPQS